VLADEDNHYYKLYGIRHSIIGVLKGMFMRMPRLLHAMFVKGYVPLIIKGSMTTMPADFLVDEQGIIQAAYYGKDEGVFHETLVDIIEDEYLMKYSIDDGPSPVSKSEVSDYFGVIKLSPATESNGTLVEWSSSWKSDVEDAVEFCHGIYVALLGELAESFKQHPHR